MTMKLMGMGIGVALMVVASACTIEEREPVPGTLSSTAQGGWVQGDWSQVKLTWSNDNECDLEDWGCREKLPITITLMDKECSGCEVIDVPSGVTADHYDGLVLAVQPTSDAEVVLTAAVRFDATGHTEIVEMRQPGDHEEGIETHCRVINMNDLGRLKEGRELSFASSLFRPCGATRTATETVVIFPAIRTFRGRAIFPFEGQFPTPGERTLSQWTFSSGPALWSYSDVVPTRYFAVVPPEFPGTSVTVSAPLANGTTGTAVVEIPPVR